MADEIAITIIGRDRASAALRGVRGAVSDLEQTAGRASSGVGGFFKSALSFAAGGAILGGLSAVGGAVGGLAKGMVSGNAEFERYQTQFGVLLKSSDKAKERLSALAKFGASTPFELPELVQADKVLTAFGLHSEDTQKRFGVSGEQILSTIGDVSAGTGVSFEELSGTFGKFASGATGEAISRFQELGIATREQMASWGLEFSKSGQLLTPTAEAFTVLESHVREKFGGMMQAQSMTFEGMVSNLQDWFGQTMRLVGAPIFEVLKEKLGVLLAFLNDPGTQAAITTFATMLAEGIGQAMDFLANTAIPMLTDAWNTIAPLIGAALPIFQGIIDALTQSGDSTSAWSGIWENVSSTVSAIIGAIGAVVTAVFGQIATFLAAHGDEITDFLLTAWQQIGSIVQTAVELVRAIIVPIFTFIASFINAHGTEIQAILTNTWNAIKAIIDGALTLIKGVLTAVLQAIHGDWSGAWETIKATAARIWEDIKTVISSAANNLITILGPIWEAIKSAATTAWEGIKSAISTKWEEIKTDVSTKVNALPGIIRGAVGALVQAGADLVNGIKQGIMNKWGEVTAWIGQQVAKLPEPVRKALGIGSPSTVFAEQVGAPIAEGILAGWQTAFPEVSAGMTASMQTVTDGLAQMAALVGEGVTPEVSTLAQTLQSELGAAFDAISASMHEETAPSLDEVGKRMDDLATKSIQMAGQVRDAMVASLNATADIAETQAGVVEKFFAFTHQKTEDLSARQQAGLQELAALTWALLDETRTQAEEMEQTDAKRASAFYRTRTQQILAIADLEQKAILEVDQVRAESYRERARLLKESLEAETKALTVTLDAAGGSARALADTISSKLRSAVDGFAQITSKFGTPSADEFAKTLEKNVKTAAKDHAEPAIKSLGKETKDTGKSFEDLAKKAQEAAQKIRDAFVQGLEGTADLEKSQADVMGKLFDFMHSEFNDASFAGKVATQELKDQTKAQLDAALAQAKHLEETDPKAAAAFYQMRTKQILDIAELERKAMTETDLDRAQLYRNQAQLLRAALENETKAFEAARVELGDAGAMAQMGIGVDTHRFAQWNRPEWQEELVPRTAASQALWGVGNWQGISANDLRTQGLAALNTSRAQWGLRPLSQADFNAIIAEAEKRGVTGSSTGGPLRSWADWLMERYNRPFQVGGAQSMGNLGVPDMGTVGGINPQIGGVINILLGMAPGMRDFITATVNEQLRLTGMNADIRARTA